MLEHIEEVVKIPFNNYLPIPFHISRDNHSEVSLGAFLGILLGIWNM